VVVSCILQRDNHTTAFCGLVDTGDFYLGGGNSSHTLVHTACGQVPQGSIQMSCHSTGWPVHGLPVSCMYNPLEWCVLCWHPVATCKDNHPHITTFLSSVNSWFRHLDHGTIINIPPPPSPNYFFFVQLHQIFMLWRTTCRIPTTFRLQLGLVNTTSNFSITFGKYNFVCCNFYR
jgi:hypothetical protein